MSNSSLVNYIAISPNSSNPRNQKITKITIHHMAGNLSVETCGRIFASSSRQASSNYGIGSDGRVGMYVEEKNRPWTSSSAWNDNRAVTIEVANDGGAPNWHVSDKALNKLIELCVDICKRNGISELVYDGTKNGSLTRHNMFANTTCPGPYLQSKFPYIASEVNKRLKGNTSNNTSTSNTSKKSIDEIAKDVIAGKYGNYPERKTKLEAEGYNYSEVQAKVNQMLGTNKTSNNTSTPTTNNSSNILELVKKTIRGDFGNGDARRNALGSNFDEVQRQVNLNYQHGTTRWDNIKLY